MKPYKEFADNFKKKDSSLCEDEIKILYVVYEASPDALTEDEIVARVEELNKQLNLN